MVKIIFLNGPPGSGKDTVANGIVSSLGRTRAKNMKFAGMLKDTCHSMVGLGHVATDCFEKTKDLPNHMLPYDPVKKRNMTPRELYIWFSEEVLKPKFGKEHFGNVLVNQIENVKHDGFRLIVISDSGFKEEALPVIKKFGIENCLLVHLCREGKNFDNDSRSYWEHSGLTTVTANNSGSLKDINELSDSIISSILPIPVGE